MRYLGVVGAFVCVIGGVVGVTVITASALPAPANTVLPFYFVGLAALLRACRGSGSFDLRACRVLVIVGRRLVCRGRSSVVVALRLVCCGPVVVGRRLVHHTNAVCNTRFAPFFSLNIRLGLHSSCGCRWAWAYTP